MILPLDRMRADQFASVRTSEAEPHAAVKKLFGPNAGSTARHGETTEALARLCPMARRGIADPPLFRLLMPLANAIPPQLSTDIFILMQRHSHGRMRLPVN
jgi:hypothetical protein